MPPRQPHNQVSAKVTTYVDEEIKELIEILNTFDKVSTFESCQGRKGRKAFVYMEYDSLNICLKETAEFANRLAIALVSKIETGISPDPAYDVDIAVEWWGDKKLPFISIRFPSGLIKEVTDVFAQLQTGFENDK